MQTTKTIPPARVSSFMHQQVQNTVHAASDMCADMQNLDQAYAENALLSVCKLARELQALSAAQSALFFRACNYYANALGAHHTVCAVFALAAENAEDEFWL
jgi:hypothetical protein